VSVDVGEEIDTVLGLSPPGTLPVPDDEPVPLTETRGTGLAAGVIGVNGLLPGNGPCLEMEGSPMPARDSRFGALSDAAGPQLASPIRNSRLTKDMYGRDRHMLLESFREPRRRDWGRATFYTAQLS
jgi:hypothetical protein